MPDTILTTCPRDCYDGCGVAVLRRNGSVAVRGDIGHFVSRGRLCRKCTTGYNGAWLDASARLTRPLRRVGPKGDGGFEPIGWDDAIALIAARLSAITAGPGPQTILNSHYTGTCSLIAGKFPLRFFNRLGATEIDPDSVCNKAGHLALGYLYGDSELGFDPRTARDASCIVVWGANPSASAPHVDEHWLGATDAPVIVVDPVRTPTAAAADLHLQPFPGSDAALAFALLHVLWRDGLTDDDFIVGHTFGFSELVPTIERCTPGWGERTTGVAASLIEEAARLYGRGPSLLWLGQGFQRQRTGGNAMRAVALLPAVTGNIGRPGSGFLYLNGVARLGIDADYLAGTELGDGLPRPISQMDLVDYLEDPARAQALVCWNINIAASSPDQARLQRALTREDLFTVAIDLFPTDTTDFADVILPAASFLEFNDLVIPYFYLAVSAQVKALDPPGEALPNQEIFRRLATAMGFAEPALHESDEAIIARILGQAGIGETFESLAAKGTLEVGTKPVLQFAERSFTTDSGKIEIASGAAEADGLPRLPQPLADPRPRGGRLRLLSPASPWMLNDTFANDASIAKRVGPASVSLHPDDAKALGLAEGEDAVLENDTGSIVLRVVLSDELPRGVAYSVKGRWPKREAAGVNVNVLNPGEKSDMGDSTSVHGVEVRLSPARR